MKVYKTTLKVGYMQQLIQCLFGAIQVAKTTTANDHETGPKRSANFKKQINMPVARAKYK